ncbi:MAG TPA: pantoate--beta-alanine ligase [Dokdonella sp.]|uniref:pantoate--beta-alanine ligase n=1 Tax=Dokdonella sp. TaxID=2291710 RepID=UPI002C85DE94|nr:pantoate--beta-alanine ligase [Dokdonella sp.]HUD43084.1 pantoate--beta-alanine ligase [Dokdonella sp.]
MDIFRDTAALRAALAEQRRAARRIALVPTMGNLHAGHHSLIALAREHADFVVASVFVNPTQFGPNEDFARYPRTPDADAEGLAQHGCDAMFAPAVDDLYPFGAEAAVRIHVPGLSDILDGASRPGHFDGVATVVTRLFNRVQPDVAVFGRKDYQQLLVIERLVEDLALPIRIVGAPIVREASGLALSSRNQYLDAGQRERAASIHATLVWMREQALGGAEPARVEALARQRLAEAGFEPDYAVIRRAADLEPLEAGASAADAIALIAARLGSTRLIDNLRFG